jgi:dienelactone hydrolase
MTNQQMEQVYSGSVGIGHAAALRVIYTLGYCAGAGQTVSAQTPDEARAATPIAPATVQQLIMSPAVKKPD